MTYVFVCVWLFVCLCGCVCVFVFVYVLNPTVTFLRNGKVLRIVCLMDKSIKNTIFIECHVVLFRYFYCLKSCIELQFGQSWTIWMHFVFDSFHYNEMHRNVCRNIRKKYTWLQQETGSPGLLNVNRGQNSRLYWTSWVEFYNATHDDGVCVCMFLCVCMGGLTHTVHMHTPLPHISVCAAYACED